MNNEVPYVLAPNSGPISTSTCVVVVKVRDVDEGPEFNPKIYILDIKECLKVGTEVGQYTASDPETGNSEDIRYCTLLLNSLSCPFCYGQIWLLWYYRYRAETGKFLMQLEDWKDCWKAYRKWQRQLGVC